MLKRPYLPHLHIRVQYLDGPGAERRAEEVDTELPASVMQLGNPVGRQAGARVALRWVDEDVRQAEQLEFASVGAGVLRGLDGAQGVFAAAHMVAAELGYNVGVIVTQRHVPPPVQTPAWRATEQPGWARRRSISQIGRASCRERAQCTPTR